MSTTNAEVADLLRRYAAALSLEDANRFKLKAYRRAAETIEVSTPILSTSCAAERT